LVHEDGKQRRWTGTYGGGSWRRPRPTQVVVSAKNNNNNEDITVLWKQGVQTDREVLVNRPDIIIKNKKYKFAY
jgi:hypothetical protein